MSDKKWEVIKTLIMAAAIIAAAIILGSAIRYAGWYIFQGLDHISGGIVSAFPH